MSLVQVGRIIAPYITSNDAEPDLNCSVVMLPGNRGVGYAQELPGDRDGHGVLWQKVVERPGKGKPRFGKVHPARQRRAMAELLCQVCAGPADRTADGVLWLFQDHREDWKRWPEGMAAVEPPVCVGCVAISLRRCPALQRSAVAVRVRSFEIVGVRGTLYRPGLFAPTAVLGTEIMYCDPMVHWMVAVNLVRELRECSFVPFDELLNS
ncbi:hypothetical protein JNUCC0626_36605 [Lentzea sp. JNUCC 0626]|uniref:hypothetical protein n=1 Tax=Lentzea sp. JNUCC 0626 TaxID=3367513 RepID=UPI003747AD02